MKKVLLTGANGFIGRNCIPFLLERGYEVHGVSTHKILPENTAKINWHQANLLDLSQCNQLLDLVKPTHLLHFAWITTPKKYWTTLENFNWVQASVELLKAFNRNSGKRLVIAGSCAEYDWKYGLCSEAFTPAVPDTLYGACKYSLHLMAEAFCKETEMSGAWARIFFTYGPHSHPSSLVSLVINALLKKEKIAVSHGNQIRDFLHVQDLADAFVNLLDCEKQGTFNIGSGQPVTLKRIFNTIAQKLNGEQLIDYGGFSPALNDPAVLIPDLSKFKSLGKWQPKYSLEDGIENTIDWWKTHNTIEKNKRQL